MQVRDVMSAPTVIVPTVTPAQEAARHLDYSGVGCLIVADGDKALGIVTDRDLALRVLGRGLPGTTQVGVVMSRNLVTVAPGDDIDMIAVLFRKHALRRLPVVEDGTVVGMVTIDDLLLHTHQVVGDLLGPVAAEILEPQHALVPPGS
jgi:signal-transduction protein with cAMP-binding, CBS, and nucleotidyltransferase domain